MKIIVKPSLIKSIAKDFKIDCSSLEAAFPRSVNSDYEQVWKKFIDTQAVRDIISVWEKDTGIVYCALAFMLYIRSIDKKAVPPANFFKLSMSLVNLENQSNRIYDYLYRNNFTNHMRQYVHEIKVSSEQNEFLSAYTNIRLVGFMAYKAMGRYTLDGLLHDGIKQLVFPKVVPPQLLSTVGKANKPKKMYSLHQLKKRPHDWCRLVVDKNPFVIIDVARAKFGTLVLRYEIMVPNLIFHANQKAVNDSIKKEWYRIKKL